MSEKAQKPQMVEEAERDRQDGPAGIGSEAAATVTLAISSKEKQSESQKESSSASDSNKGNKKPKISSSSSRSSAISFYIKQFIMQYIGWMIPIVKDWTKMKVVLRSALSAWICMLCLLISPVEIAVGTASFLLLVGIFIAPCELPVVATIERELIILFLICLCWAYANLAIFFAHLSRHNKVSMSEADINMVYSGRYIETAPTAICATFLAIGSALCLYLKVKFGPSPFLMATILGCIQLDITLVYAPLFPYPFYLLGQSVVIPLALKAGINIFVSCLFFPKSANSSFVERLLTVMKPIGDSPTMLLDLFKQSVTDPNFAFNTMHNQVTKAEAGLTPLRGSARLITREISFSLANGQDLKGLIDVFISLIAPADGVSYYYKNIQADLQSINYYLHPKASRFTTPIPTRPGTPTQSKPATPTIEEESHGDQHADEAFTSSTSFAKRLLRPQLASTDARSASPASSLRRHGHELRHRMQNTLHSWHWKHHHREEPVEVGLWESLRYSAIETQQHSRQNDRYTQMCFDLLGQVSHDLLTQQSIALQTSQSWLVDLNSRRLRKLWNAILLLPTKNDPPSGKLEDGQEIKSLEETINELQKALDEFKVKKQILLDPFRSSVERRENDDEDVERIPHRYLFQCFTFCYFQVQFTSRIIAFLEALQRIKQARTQWQFWYPSLPKLFTMDTWRSFGEKEDEHDVEEHDEDPDTIPGMISSLGKTKARDPEVLERQESGLLQDIGLVIGHFSNQLFRGHSLFMIKVGIVTVLVALPSLVSSSAGWAYRNKAIWTIIMAQLTFARHRGEVLFSLASRVIATFGGALIGLVVWYIASGNGKGSPYAMAVVTAFGFVFLMLLRLHMPGPPITTLITCITAALIIGYSWKDTHNPTFGSPGYGWNVAWRRFLEVIIGALAAYIGAILPPSSSMRKYYRLSHATAIAEIGGMYCQTVTLAVTPDSLETKVAIQHLIAIRNKVRRLSTLKANISYEWSARGKWPLKRYNELEEVELQLSKLLTHSINICEDLGPIYSRALLRRIHFLNPLFLADCIAVLTMCATSLRTSQPLPQIVPILIDRYLKFVPGFQFRTNPKDYQHDTVDLDQNTTTIPNHHHHHHHSAMAEEETIEKLPKIVTFKTLETKEYQIFAVGVTVAYGIVLRLDRLCMAVKALVGETYSVPTDLHYSYDY